MIRTGGRYYQDPKTGELRRADASETAIPAPAEAPQPAAEEAPAPEAEPSSEPATDAATPAKKG